MFHKRGVNAHYTGLIFGLFENLCKVFVILMTIFDR
jgi:hypothetical protein